MQKIVANKQLSDFYEKIKQRKIPLDKGISETVCNLSIGGDEIVTDEQGYGGDQNYLSQERQRLINTLQNLRKKS